MEKEQLLTEPEHRLISRYAELRKKMGHTGAILMITQENKRSLGDTDATVKRIAAKLFAAYSQMVVEESTFKEEAPRVVNMVTCRLINGNHCSVCGTVILPGEDLCGNSHELGQQYPDYDKNRRQF